MAEFRCHYCAQFTDNLCCGNLFVGRATVVVTSPDGDVETWCSGLGEDDLTVDDIRDIAYAHAPEFPSEFPLRVMLDAGAAFLRRYAGETDFSGI